MNKIRFYKAHDPYGFFSNFYEAPVIIDNILYKTTEHYYQACKFKKGTVEWTNIVNASTPQEVVKIARALNVPDNWNDIKYNVMKRAVFNKFYQHEHLAKLLRDTGDSFLVEDTVGTVRPDEWWGNGATGDGRNWLGEILMLVRGTL